MFTFPVIADSLSTPLPPGALDAGVSVFAAFEKDGDGEDGIVDVKGVVKLDWGATKLNIPFN